MIPNQNCILTISKDGVLYFNCNDLGAGEVLSFGYNTSISTTIDPNKYYKCSYINKYDISFDNPGLNPKRIKPSEEVFVRNSLPKIFNKYIKNYSENDSEIELFRSENITFVCKVNDTENETKSLKCDLIHVINGEKYSIPMSYNDSDDIFGLDLVLSEVGEHKFEINAFDGTDNVSLKYNNTFLIDVCDSDIEKRFVLLSDPYCYDKYKSEFIISKEEFIDVKCFSKNSADDIGHLNCTLIDIVSNMKYPMIFNKSKNIFEYNLLLNVGEHKFEIEIYYPNFNAYKTHKHYETYFVKSIPPLFSLLFYIFLICMIPVIWAHIPKTEKYTSELFIIRLFSILRVLSILLVLSILAVMLYYNESIYLRDVHKYELLVLVAAILAAPIILQYLSTFFEINRTGGSKFFIGLFIIMFMFALNLWIEQLNNSNYDNRGILGILIIVLPIVAIILDRRLNKNKILNTEQKISNSKLTICSFLTMIASIGVLLFVINIINHPTNSIVDVIIILTFEFFAVLSMQIPELILVLIDVILKHRNVFSEGSS